MNESLFHARHDALMARECRRVLKPAGTLWIECGDSYNSATSTSRAASTLEGSHGYWANPLIKHRINVAGVKPKDLIGAPWLLAFALRADGWYLRQCLIWNKPNCMPESAKDRCTTAHSYVFLFSKKPRYWFDSDAIAEPAAWERWGDQTTPKHNGTATASGWVQPKTKRELQGEVDHRYAGLVGQRWSENGNGTQTKTARSVWTIPTQGYPEAHFATWPEALAERIVKAGCPEWVCGVCGKPRERITNSLGPDKPQAHSRHVPGGQRRQQGLAKAQMGSSWSTGTLGWTSCECPPLEIDGRDVTKWRPGTILDPFMGAGTTALVARRLGRHSIGVELNEKYAAMCARRLGQQSLLARGAA